MLDRIKTLLSSPIFEDDEERTRIADLLNSMLLAMLVIGLMFVPIGALTHGSYNGVVIIMAILTALTPVMLLLLRRGYVMSMSVLLVFLFFVTAIGCVLVVGSIRVPIASLFILCVVVAGLLLGHRGTAVVTMLSQFALLGLWWAETAGMLPPYRTAGFAPFETLAALLLGIAVLLVLNRRNLDDTLKRARHGEQALTERNRQLKAEITERKRAEEVLRRFELLVTHSRDIFFVINREDGRILEANEAATKAYGYSREQLLTMSLHQLRPPETLELLSDQMEQADVEGILLETVHCRGDGSTFPVEVSSRGETIGGVRTLISVVRDITERKRAEDERRLSEQRFRKIFEESPIGIAFLNEQREIFRTNQSYRDFLGYSEDEIIERGPVGLLHPDDWAASVELSMKLRAGEIPQFHMEQRYVRKDGTIVWADTHITVVRDRDGRLMHTMGWVQDITERKQAEIALRESEELYRTLVSLSPDAISVADLNGLLTFTSPKALQMFGYSPDDEILGRSILSWVALEEREKASANIRHILTEGTIIDSEYTMLKKDGTRFIGEVNAAVIHSHDGSPMRMIVVTRDVTERKRAEEALRLSEGRLRSAMEATRQGWFDLNVQTGEVNVSPEYARIIGYEPEKFQTCLKNWIEAIHPEDRKAVLNAFRECLETTDTRTMEYRRQTKTGNWRWIRSTGKIVGFDPENKPLRMTGTHADITEQKLAESALRESEELHRTILKTAMDGFWVVDLQGRLQEVNATYCRMSGYSEAELLTMGLPDLNVGETADEIAAHAQKIVAQGEDRFETLHRRKDGSIMDVEVSAQYGATEGGRLISFVRDITERKRAEVALEESEAKFRSYIESAPLAILVADRQGRVMDFNPAALELLGYNDAILRGMNVLDLHRAEDHDEIRGDLATLLDVGHVEIERRMKKSNGQLIWVSLRAVTTSNQLTLGYCQDISERKRMEEDRSHAEAQLRQAQKMESVGRLAGGVAHDFNNMLGIILGHAEMALDYITPDQPLFADLQEIRKAAERSADLTRQLLAFARKQIVAPKVLDLNETVDGMLKLLRRLIGEDIDLAWMPGAGAWPVKVDPSQIDQIMANLCVNARDAIAGVGKLTIETTNTVFYKTCCAEHVGFVKGEFVMLAVSDNGCGMNKEVLNNIFDPFFTTKELGRGTGLGLSTVYGIVNQNNGFINVYSEPGQGTTFKIYLPRAEEQTTEKPPVNLKKNLRGNETVLLVEDEEPLLVLGKAILQRHGYEVLATKSPTEALGLAQSHPGPIHLLLTDVVMPEMNGKDLRDKLAELKSGVRSIFMSGYTANVIAHHGILDVGVDFLQKPFSVQTLLEKVRNVLEE